MKKSKALVMSSIIASMMCVNQVVSLTATAATNPEASKKIIHRESWDSSYAAVDINKCEKEYKTTCTAIVYDDKTVEICLQSYDSPYLYYNDINFGYISYNDSLYSDAVYVRSDSNEYDSITKIHSQVYSIESYNDINKNIYYTYQQGNHVLLGKVIQLKLRPIEAFDCKTEITAFGNTITINPDGTENQTDTEPFGDINNDGVINSKDATCILQYAAYVGTGGSLDLKEYIKSKHSNK